MNQSPPTSGEYTSPTPLSPSLSHHSAASIERSIQTSGSRLDNKQMNIGGSKSAHDTQTQGGGPKGTTPSPPKRMESEGREQKGTPPSLPKSVDDGDTRERHPPPSVLTHTDDLNDEGDIRERHPPPSVLTHADDLNEDMGRKGTPPSHLTTRIADQRGTRTSFEQVQRTTNRNVKPFYHSSDNEESGAEDPASHSQEEEEAEAMRNEMAKLKAERALIESKRNASPLPHPRSWKA